MWKIIDHDLKINIGPKFLLAAIHPKAYEGLFLASVLNSQAFVKSHNLKLIIQRCLDHTLEQELKAEKEHEKEKKTADKDKDSGGGLNVGMSLMTPIKPMLARFIFQFLFIISRACKTTAEVMKRCPKGFFSEIKYDGERIQIHKDGDEYKCYSRTLKPVMEWKVHIYL